MSASLFLLSEPPKEKKKKRRRKGNNGRGETGARLSFSYFHPFLFLLHKKDTN